MSIKECSYINCENYVIDNVSNGHFTMFQFPRDPVRRKIWMAHAKGKDPPNNIQEKLYMCSDHFDKKFMSITQRRTALVGAAVPYPVNEIDIKTEPMTKYLIFANDIEDLRQHNNNSPDDAGILEEDSNDINADIGSTTGQEEEGITQCNEECQVFKGDNELSQVEDYDLARQKPTSHPTANCYNGKRRILAQTSTHNFKKRISFSNGTTVSSSSSTSPLQVQITTNDNRLTNGQNYDITADTSGAGESNSQHSEEASAMEFIEEELFNKDATTFIFKGDEYVQMKKKDYIQEKIDLLVKIREYEDVLRRIKYNISTIDSSLLA